MSEKIWLVIIQSANSTGASTELSSRLKRIVCEYCGVANPIGGAYCLACGGPFGKQQPTTCRNCGFVVHLDEKLCPNCKQEL